MGLSGKMAGKTTGPGSQGKMAEGRQKRVGHRTWLWDGLT